MVMAAAVAVVALSLILDRLKVVALQRQSMTDFACLLPSLRSLAPAARQPGGSAHARAEEGEQRQFFRPPAIG